MAPSLRLIPPRGARMSQVVWQTSVPHASAQCQGIVGHSRPTNTVVAKGQRAGHRPFQIALRYARGSDDDQPRAGSRSRKARSGTRRSRTSSVLESKKGLVQQLIILPEVAWSES
jgi:triphosphoribosyl-dephospho-CoA synthetase